ncbi:MAG TPA: GH1 family beta-glucosidase [Prolixibacteraceae bacterium]|nr:GH1 family beta-glucosidase [Prolixibacteraceae bacterium]
MKKFTNGFVWGTSTSSYQIEGAAFDDGKGPSIWDAFVRIPGKTVNSEHADVACDFYHTYREDIALMAKMGIKAFRFSFSWPRILPSGKGEINELGIQFYSDMIDCLLENNIEPWATLYHWDLPLELQMAHDGWLNPNIAEDFAQYADICFEHFGNRVKNWITINEPWVVAILGYGQGVFAPGRVSKTEPYLAAHNELRAHAQAVKIYREKYQAEQKGQIGISLNCDWREPLTDKPEDHEAAERALLFFAGWFADPIWVGDYPEEMRRRIGHKLPQFTPEEKEMLVGSSDFFGLNHYTTMFAANAKETDEKQSVYGNGGISEDQNVDLSVDPAWETTSMDWAVVPWGFRKLLEWIDKRYSHPAIIVTENGMSNDDSVVNGEVIDTPRINFIKNYLEASHEAMQNGVNLQGYFAWSLLDNFEWALGYQKQFGLVHVDMKTLERTPKASAYWYSGVVKNNGID